MSEIRKKKKKLIPIIVFVFILVCIVGAVLYMNAKSLTVSSGLYLKADNGSHMLIVNQTPIQLSNRTDNQNIFNMLTDGDRILVLHDGIAESYPAKTGLYALLKRSDGAYDDIPTPVIESLTELGWLNRPNRLSATESFPSAPPSIIVKTEDQSVLCLRGSYSWSRNNGDGTGSVVHADGMHPLETVHLMTPLVVTKPSIVTLVFEVEPDSVSVKRYDLKVNDSGVYETIIPSENTFEVECGEYLYEIIARWDKSEADYHGGAHYAFRTEN